MGSDRVALILEGNGWATRAVVCSLARRGWTVIAPAGTKCARSRHCRATVRIPDYKTDVSRFVDAVADILRNASVRLVVPAEDASLQLLYETPGLLERSPLPGGARVLGGSRESAMLSLDKARTLQRAAHAGFPVPAGKVPENVQDAIATAQEVGFPCVVKPTHSYAREGNALRSARLAFAFDASEVRGTVLEYLEAGFRMPLVQEWVPGRSIGVAAVVRRGRVLAWGAREAFSQYPIRGGSAVWRATVGAEEPGVIDALALLCALGFEGMGDVQYHIAPDGRPRLMEIGARTYGWLPLTIAAGADLPAIAAHALEGVEPQEVVEARPGMHMRWPLGEAMRLGEVLHRRVRLPPGASRWDVLRQLWPLVGRSIRYDGFGTRDRRLGSAPELAGIP